MSAWREIETAPKDGTHVLGWIIFAPNVVSAVPHGEQAIIYWGGDPPRWRTGFCADPTHWMPLPEPPK